MGLWSNPNFYAVLMGAGVTLTIGLLAERLKAKGQGLKEERLENLKSETLKAEMEEQTGLESADGADWRRFLPFSLLRKSAKSAEQMIGERRRRGDESCSENAKAERLKAEIEERAHDGSADSADWRRFFRFFVLRKSAESAEEMIGERDRPGCSGWRPANWFGARNAKSKQAASGVGVFGETPDTARGTRALPVILLIAALMMGTGLVMSYSRGAWIATTVGLLYLATAYGKIKWRSLTLFLFSAVCGLLLVACFFWHTPRTAPWYFQRLDLSRGSVQHRLAAWKAGFEMMRDHPFGVGWNKTVETYAQHYSPPEGGAAALATNDYLLLGTQLGIPALLCFVAYVGLCLRGRKSRGSATVSVAAVGVSPAARSGLDEARVSLQTGGEAISGATPETATGTVALPADLSPVARHLSPEASLRVACRAGALVCLVAFWFDGGLFKLATASVFWILLELGADTELAAKTHKRHKEEENRKVDATSPHSDPLPSCQERRGNSQSSTLHFRFVSSRFLRSFAARKSSINQSLVTSAATAIKRGFTLIEMLVVIAILGILASLLLPVLSRAKERAHAAQCLSNLKQMQIAWNLYANDYNGTLPMNGSDWDAGQNADDPSWVAGYLTMDSSPDNTNSGLLVGNEYRQWGSLGAYTKNAKIYHCPSDVSRDAGNGLPRVRSISMNGWINPAPGGEVSGRFLKLPFQKFVKITDYTALSPSEGFVFLDERPDSINDGWFMVDEQSYNPSSLAGLRIRDLPAIYHDGATTFSFADGHAELHLWLDPRTLALKFAKQGQSTPDNQDVLWLMEHATRPK